MSTVIRTALATALEGMPPDIASVVKPAEIREVLRSFVVDYGRAHGVVLVDEDIGTELDEVVSTLRTRRTR